MKEVQNKALQTFCRKNMKRSHLFLTACALLLMCAVVNADRGSYRWNDLLESSDFIVTAQITKVEEIPQGRYRSTFSVLQVLKGDAPKVVPVDWTLDLEDQITTLDGVRDRYILFARKNGDGFSLLHERFMKKEKDGYLSPLSLLYLDIRSLPAELKAKLKTEEVKQGDLTYSRLKIKWSDMINWLRVYLAKSEADRAVDARADSDGDGFTDLEEKDHKCDPNDPNSHPAYWSNLSVESVSTNTRTIRFKASHVLPGGATMIQLSVQNEGEKAKTYFTRIGESAARLKAVDLQGNKLTIQDGDQKHALSKGDSVSLRYGTAQLLLDVLPEQQRFAVQEEDTLRLPDGPYRVVSIDLGKATVLLFDILNKKTLLIEKSHNELQNKALDGTSQ
jgi:hypothetical protein